MNFQARPPTDGRCPWTWGLLHNHNDVDNDVDNDDDNDFDNDVDNDVDNNDDNDDDNDDDDDDDYGVDNNLGFLHHPLRRHLRDN